MRDGVIGLSPPPGVAGGWTESFGTPMLAFQP
jgi:hypothetical protein